jgi:hypothetical protein
MRGHNLICISLIHKPDSFIVSSFILQKIWLNNFSLKYYTLRKKKSTDATILNHMAVIIRLAKIMNIAHYLCDPQ